MSKQEYFNRYEIANLIIQASQIEQAVNYSASYSNRLRNKIQNVARALARNGLEPTADRNTQLYTSIQVIEIILALFEEINNQSPSSIQQYLSLLELHRKVKQVEIRSRIEKKLNGENLS